MKKCIALVSALTLLLTCSCSLKKEQPPAEPTTETAASPAALSPTQAEPATVPPGEFRLSALPEIGRFTPRQATCVYGEPLDDFRPSDDYGTVVPYVLTPLQNDYFTIGRAGFMTAEGKIITGPVYDNISLRTAGDKTFYYAEKKLMEPSPEVFDYSLLEGMNDVERERFYQRQSDYIDWVESNGSIQLIAADGSSCRTFTGVNARLFTDEISGMTVIQTGKAEEFGSGLTEQCRIYDTDFNLLADFTDLLAQYPRGLDLIGADETGYALSAEEWDPDTGEGHIYVLLFEGTALTRTVELDHCYPVFIFGNLIATHSGFFDFSGRQVLSGVTDQPQYAPSADCCFALDRSAGTVIRLNRDGSTHSYDAPWGQQTYLRLARSGGKEYLVLTWDNSFTVFDMEMNEVFSPAFDPSASVELSVRHDGNGGGEDEDVVLMTHGGVTEFYSLTGKMLARTSFALNYCEFYQDGCALLIGPDGERCLFSAKDGAVRDLPGAKEMWPSFADRRFAAFYRNEDEGRRRRVLLADAQTGETLYDGLAECKTFQVGGKTYYSLLRNNTAYVCDENLRPIASLGDGFFA